MASVVETYKPDTSILNFSAIRPFDVFVKILVENALMAFQWEAMLLRAILDLYVDATRLSTVVEEPTRFAQLKRPEAVISEPRRERIDVENAENAKTAQRAGKRKKGERGKKSDRERKRREGEERAAKREAEEKERLREWEECWEKKLQAQEASDYAECCMGEGLCPKPRTRSNIWINVTQDRSIQEIHMTFKHVPVPRPKPPPLPPLQKQRASDIVAAKKSIVQKSTVQKVDRKSGTTGRKSGTTGRKKK